MILDRLANIHAVPGPRPGYLTPIWEATYGSKVTRICGDTNTPIPNIGGAWALDSRHHYSKDQPWNDDESMIWIEQKSTYPTKMILNARTFAPILGNRGTSKISKVLDASSEVRWRPGHPNQMISWFKSTQEIVLWDVTNDFILWRAHVPSKDPGFGFISEGTISDDGNTLVLGSHFAPSAGQIDHLTLVDLERRIVGPPCFIEPCPFTDNTSKGTIGNVNISCDGMSVYIKYEGTPEYGRIFKRGWGLSEDPLSMELHPRILQPGGLRMSQARDNRYGWTACMSHADMNRTPAGRQVVVGGIRDANLSNGCTDADVKKKGRVIAIDLLTGLHTHVSAGQDLLMGLTESYDQHTSGRAYRMRGWHLVTYASVTEDPSGKQFMDEMVFWKLDGSGQCQRFGVTRTNDSAYRGEAHGVPSPSGTKVMFASNWMNLAEPASPAGATDIKSYVVEPV